MIFQRKVARPRREAVRAGWNDAAWGRPHRQVEPALAQSYESGYAGDWSCVRKSRRIWCGGPLYRTVAASRVGSLSPSTVTHVKHLV